MELDDKTIQAGVTALLQEMIDDIDELYAMRKPAEFVGNMYFENPQMGRGQFTITITPTRLKR